MAQFCTKTQSGRRIAGMPHPKAVALAAATLIFSVAANKLEWPPVIAAIALIFSGMAIIWVIVDSVRSVTPHSEFEIRFSQGEPYRLERLPYGHIRFELYNSWSIAAENVKVFLKEITPKPRDSNFRADYPFRVRRHSESSVADGDGCRVNPRNKELFEILKFWISSELRLMVDGIDTKRVGNLGWFGIEEGEQWQMKYEITCASRDPQALVFSARCERHTITVTRLA